MLLSDMRFALLCQFHMSLKVWAVQIHQRIISVCPWRTAASSPPMARTSAQDTSAMRLWEAGDHAGIKSPCSGGNGLREETH